jgi:hypothetical protein
MSILVLCCELKPSTSMSITQEWILLCNSVVKTNLM